MKWSRVIVAPFLILPWLAVVVGFAWFILLRFPLDGVRRFDFPFDGSRPWFEPFLPGQRVTPAGPQPDGWIGQRILMDPVYAGLRLPGVFDTVDVSLELRTIRQPLVELGIVRRLEPFEVENQPIYSQQLQKGWREVQVGDVHGYVREDQPDSVLTEAPLDRVLTWYASTTAPALMDVTSTTKTVQTSLRGTHDLYFIPVSGSVVFEFGFQDMNRSGGGNSVSFRLTKEDELLQTDSLSLSGSLDTRPNHLVEKTLSFKGLEAGTYRLSLSASDDVFLRRIQTSAKHWVIGPRFFAGDTVGWSTSTLPLSVWTNSRHLAVETLHKEGLQTVSFGNSAVAMTETHHSYALDRQASELAGDLKVLGPQGNVRVIGDGYFAFDREALFLPRPRRLTDASDPLAEGILAVVTPYKRPTSTIDGWTSIQARYTLPQGVDSYKLSLSAPGLFSRRGAVDIRRVGLVYERLPISWRTAWYYLKQELAAAWRRM